MLFDSSHEFRSAYAIYIAILHSIFGVSARSLITEIRTAVPPAHVRVLLLEPLGSIVPIGRTQGTKVVSSPPFALMKNPENMVL